MFMSPPCHIGIRFRRNIFSFPVDLVLANRSMYGMVIWGMKQQAGMLTCFCVTAGYPQNGDCGIFLAILVA